MANEKIVYGIDMLSSVRASMITLPARYTSSNSDWQWSFQSDASGASWVRHSFSTTGEENSVHREGHLITTVPPGRYEITFSGSYMDRIEDNGYGIQVYTAPTKEDVNSILSTETVIDGHLKLPSDVVKFEAKTSSDTQFILDADYICGIGFYVTHYYKKSIQASNVLDIRIREIKQNEVHPNLLPNSMGLLAEQWHPTTDTIYGGSDATLNIEGNVVKTTIAQSTSEHGVGIWLRVPKGTWQFTVRGTYINQLTDAAQTGTRIIYYAVADWATKKYDSNVKFTKCKQATFRITVENNEGVYFWSTLEANKPGGDIQIFANRVGWSQNGSYTVTKEHFQGRDAIVARSTALGKSIPSIHVIDPSTYNIGTDANYLPAYQIEYDKTYTWSALVYINAPSSRTTKNIDIIHSNISSLNLSTQAVTRVTRYEMGVYNQNGIDNNFTVPANTWTRLSYSFRVPKRSGEQLYFFPYIWSTNTDTAQYSLTAMTEPKLEEGCRTVWVPNEEDSEYKPFMELAEKAKVPDGQYIIINAGGLPQNPQFDSVVPVYRCHTVWGNDYLITSDYHEMVSVSTGGNYTYDGIAFTTDGHGDALINSYFNSQTFTHAYGLSGFGLKLSNKYGGNWNVEGTRFRLYSNRQAGMEAVTQLYNPNTKGFTLAIGDGELRIAQSQGFIVENVLGYTNYMAFALDVDCSIFEPDRNIQLWGVNYTDAQLWNISTDDIGYRIIANRRAPGMSMDLHNKNFVQGGNVSLWQNNETIAQNFDIIRASSNIIITYNGIKYPAMYITIDDQNGNKWQVEPDKETNDIVSGRNICVDRFNDDPSLTDRMWIFVPLNEMVTNDVKKFITGGAYTLTPVGDVNSFLDSNGIYNGANASVLPYSGSQGQLWYVGNKPNSDKYYLRNGRTNYYLDVWGKTDLLSEGLQVEASILDSDDDGTQLWNITAVSSAEIRHSKPALLVTLGITGDDGTQWNLSVADGMNVVVNKASNDASQRWWLVKEEDYDPNVPIPNNITLETYHTINANQDAIGIHEGAKNYYYISWQCADAWMTGANGYEYRWRRRFMPNRSNFFGLWGEWTHGSFDNDPQTYGFGSDQILYRNNLHGAKIPLKDINYSIEQYRNCEYQIEVRATGPGDYGEMIHGGSSTKTIHAIWVPDYTFTQCGITKQGLHIDFTSNYGHTSGSISQSYGVSYLYLESIYDDTLKKYIYQKEVKYAIPSMTGNIYIPYTDLKVLPNVSDHLTIRYKKGNDQYIQWPEYYSSSITVASHAGNVDTGIIVDSYYRHTGIVSIKNPKDTNEIYMMVGNIKWPLKQYNNESNKYILPYPFDTNFSVYVSVDSSDHQKWGVEVLDTTAEKLGLDPSPVHVWIDSDNRVWCLDCRKDETLETSKTMSAVYAASVVDAREHEFVSGSPTVKTSFTAEGALLYGRQVSKHTDATLKDFDSLVNTHCLYRDPRGHMTFVYISKVSYQAKSDYADITVSMIEETR